MPRTEHWFEPVADHLGSAYLRYSFTKGTDQEVAFLVDELGLRAGHRVLDVGCGPGRHARALAGRGIDVVGVDVSARFIELAAAGAPANVEFIRLDARDLPYDGEFDVALSLCQGAFGLLRGDDATVLEGMARAVRPGGTVVVTAVSAYFAVRFLEERDQFDAATGVHHERTTARDESGREAPFDLWTTCFTPRELRLLAERAGLAVRSIWSVAPGDYRRTPPDLDHPEYLVVADRRGASIGVR